jgi:uncharacterized protein YggT (Ycf19 family)
MPARRWPALLALVLLLLGRALLHRFLGPDLERMPTLSLGPLALPFRSNSLTAMMLFSLATFLQALGTVTLWLLLLAILNRSLPENDPAQRVVHHLLGWLARLPTSLQWVLPPLFVGLAWWSLATALEKYGVLPKATAPDKWRQSMVFASWTWLACRDFLLGVLATCFLNSHVYLGNLPIWHYLGRTGRNLLRPLRILPLVWGRIDVAPIVAMMLVFFAVRYAALGLAWLYFHPIR